MNKQYKKIIGVLATTLCIFSVQAEKPLRQAEKKPNIVFILIDDMGWKDMACSGSTFYETPRIDALARSGLRFVNGYSSSPVCAPSRGAIFSGKNPARTKFTTVYRAGKELANDDSLFKVSKKRAGKNGQNQTYEALHRHNLPSTTPLFAEPLRDAGYATGFFGKWHCGSHENYRPDKRGFEVAIGYRHAHVPTAKSRHWGRTFKQYAVGMGDMGKEEYVADYLTDKCIDFIRDNREQPFLAVLSHYLVHSPIEGKPEKVTYFNNKPKTDQTNSGYAAMLASVDESVGRVVDCLANSASPKIRWWFSRPITAACHRGRRQTIHCLAERAPVLRPEFAYR